MHINCIDECIYFSLFVLCIFALLGLFESMVAILGLMGNVRICSLMGCCCTGMILKITGQ